MSDDKAPQLSDQATADLARLLAKALRTTQQDADAFEQSVAVLAFFAEQLLGKVAHKQRPDPVDVSTARKQLREIVALIETRRGQREQARDGVEADITRVEAADQQGEVSDAG